MHHHRIVPPGVVSGRQAGCRRVEAGEASSAGTAVLRLKWQSGDTIEFRTRGGCMCYLP